MSAPELTKIIQAAEAIHRHGKDLRASAKEIRLHPDDYDELVRDSLCPIAHPWDRPETLYGLPVFVDEAAPRLPRRPKP